MMLLTSLLNFRGLEKRHSDDTFRTILAALIELLQGHRHRCQADRWRVKSERDDVVAISGSPPNLSAVPAGSTDAHRPIDCRHTHPKWVHPLGEVIATKQPAAERALEPGMRPTAVDTAEARVVAALDAAPVLEVLCEVVAFGRAGLARTDSLVPFDEVGMLSTKCPAAVLAIVLRGAVAA